MNVSDNILLFDGVCNLCNALVRFIIKKDRHSRIKFAPLQADSQYITSLLGNFDTVPVDMETVIYISGNRIFFKSSAILHLMRDIGGLWRLLYVFIIVPGVIRDLFYLQIARSRYLIFGKRDTCMIPDTDVADRFLA